MDSSSNHTRCFFDQPSWYVFGFHSQRGEIRCLKLNRFTDVTYTEDSYVIPKEFSVRNHLGKAWRMIRGKHTYKVEVRIDADFAETIEDTCWHSTQRVHWNEDDSIIFRCTVDGLDEIVWWIMSMGPHCVVLEPQELAERVKSLAQSVLNNYSNHN